MTTIITENHRNSMRSSLLVAEKRLQGIKSRLESPIGKRTTIMYAELDNIDITVKPKMLRLIDAMLNEISKMQEDFDLDVSKDNYRGYVLAALSEIWVVLEEITPNNLKAYGQVSKDEKALIGPRVSKLLKQLNELESMLDK
jgi:hypothetical protein